MARVQPLNPDLTGVRDLLAMLPSFQRFVGVRADNRAAAADLVYAFTIERDDSDKLPDAMAILDYGENYVYARNAINNRAGREVEPEIAVLFFRPRQGDEQQSSHNALVGMDNAIEAIIADLFTYHEQAEFEIASVRRISPEQAQEYERDEWDGVLSGILIAGVLRGDG